MDTSIISIQITEEGVYTEIRGDSRDLIHAILISMDTTEGMKELLRTAVMMHDQSQGDIPTIVNHNSYDIN